MRSCLNSANDRSSDTSDSQIIYPKNMNYFTEKIFAVLSVAVLYAGCNSPRFVAVDPPGFYVKEEICYSSVTAVANSVTRGVEQLVSEARQHLRECLEQQSQQTLYPLVSATEEEERELARQRLMQLSRGAMDQAILNSSFDRQKIIKKGGRWQITIVLQLPILEVLEQFMDRIWADTWLYYRLRTSRLFIRYEKEVQSYKAWKRKIATP